MDLLQGLNESQQQAVIASGNVRVIAGAGSGKTRVLTHRIAYLISKGVPSYRILAITFTNKAAKEMKERVVELLGPEGTGCHISTFHSLCVRILREDIHALEYPRNFIIMDAEDQKKLLKDFYKELNIDAKMFSYASVLSYISNQKQRQITPEQAMAEAGDLMGLKNKAILYKMYLTRQKQLYALDFDDLLIKTVELFDRFEMVLQKWVHRFAFIHVDEFQDTNDIQYQLIKQLSSNRENVFVVGDPDQTIYSFRGANVQFIMNFDRDFPYSQTITLDRNYRSTQQILDGANHIIKNNKNRLEKDLYTDISGEHAIIHYSAMDEKAEANFVAEKIEALINEVDGINYEDFAILYRANYLSREIEQALIHHQIDYRVFGGLKFFERKEIKDMLSYLRMIVNHADDLSFARIINVPRRGVGPKAMDQIIRFSRENRMSMFEAVKSHMDQLGLSAKVKKEIQAFVGLILKFENTDKKVTEVYEYLLEVTGYLEMINEDQDFSRLDNLNELKIGMNDYHSRMEELGGEGSLDHYLQEIALYTTQDVSDENPHYVSLMTIHMAKGLEFNYVFVIGMSENIFPSNRSLDEGEDGLEEERRLAYVAFTRAKQRLFLTDSQGYSFVSNGMKYTSRFISELDAFVKREGKTYVDDEFTTFDDHFSFEPIPSFYVEEPVEWAVGDCLEHSTFGEGIVLEVIDDNIRVAFSVQHGIKKLKGNHVSLTRK